MSSYLYTNMLGKIRCLESKIHRLEDMCDGGLGQRRDVLCCQSAHNLVNETQNLKKDLLYKRFNGYEDKKLMQLYDKVCALELELTSLIKPTGLCQGKRAKPRECQSNIAYYDLPYRPCRDYIDTHPREVVKSKPRSCIPQEHFFEKLPNRNKTLTNSVEVIYYDMSTTSSSLTLTDIIDDCKPRKKRRKSYRKNLLFDVRKSRSKPSVVTVKQKSKVQKQRKVHESNLYERKPPKKRHRRKSLKKKTKSHRRKRSWNIGLTKSESPSIGVYSEKRPKPQSEIYFVRKTRETPMRESEKKHNSPNKEKYSISRLRAINKTRSQSLKRKNKPFKLNNSSPSLQYSDRNNRSRDRKPSRTRSRRKKNSETSIESRYIKSKWRRNSPPQNRPSSRRKDRSPPLIVARSSLISSSPFLNSSSRQYVILSSSSTSNDTLINASSYKPNYSKFRKRRNKIYISSDSDSNIVSRYEIVDSFYDIDSYSIPDEQQPKFVSNLQRPIYSQTLPTTVYNVNNEIPLEKFGLSPVQDDVVFVNEQSDLMTFLNGEKLNKNVIILKKEESSLPKTENSNRSCAGNFTKYKNITNNLKNERMTISKPKNDNRAQKNPFMNNKTVVKYPVYYTSVPVSYQNDQQRKVPFNSDSNTQQIKTNVTKANSKSSLSTELFSVEPTPIINLHLETKNNQAVFLGGSDQSPSQLKTNQPKVPTMNSEDGERKSQQYRSQTASVSNIPGDKKKSGIQSSLSKLWKSSKTKLSALTPKPSSTKTLSHKKSLSRSGSKVISSTSKKGPFIRKKSRVESEKGIKKSFDSKIRQSLKKSNSKMNDTEKGVKKSFDSKIRQSLKKSNSKLNDTKKSAQLGNNLKTFDSKTQQSLKKSNSKMNDTKKSAQSKVSVIRKLLGKKKKSKDILSERDVQHKNLDKNVSGPLNRGISAKGSRISQDSDNLLNPLGPRSVSGYYDEPSNSTEFGFLGFSKEAEIEDTVQSQEKKTLKKTTSSKVPLKQNVILKNLEKQDSHILVKNDSRKNRLFYEQDQKLNYSLKFSREKRKCVECNSIPNTLCLEDILPRDCKTILSTEEAMLSEHKFNGLEMHNKQHQFFINSKPHYKHSHRLVGKNNCRICQSEVDGLTNFTSRSVITGELKSDSQTSKTYYKEIPITRSFQTMSVVPSTLDWKTIVNEIKECN